MRRIRFDFGGALVEGTAEFARYKQQTAREYLRGVADAKAACRTIRAEIDELADADLGAVDYSRPWVKSSADRDRVARVVEKRDELSRMYADELSWAMQRQADAHRLLAHVAQPFRDILTRRYLLGMTWRDVAVDTNFSEDYARKELNGAALIACYDAMRVELPEAI